MINPSSSVIACPAAKALAKVAGSNAAWTVANAASARDRIGPNHIADLAVRLLGQAKERGSSSTSTI